MYEVWKDPRYGFVVIGEQPRHTWDKKFASHDKLECVEFIRATFTVQVENYDQFIVVGQYDREIDD